MEIPQHIANDNERIKVCRKLFGTARNSTQPLKATTTAPVSYILPARSTTFQTSEFKRPNPVKTTEAQETKGFLDKTGSNMLALLVCIGSFVLLFYSNDLSLSPLLKIAVAIFSGWCSLFLILTSRRQQRPRYKSLGHLGLMASLAAIGFFLNTGFNIGGAGAPILSLGALITAGLAAILKEKAPLVMASALTLVWAVLALFDQNNTQLMWLFPAILGLQLHLASTFKSSLSMTLLVTSAYVWLGASLYALTMSGYLSPIMGMTALICAGTLHTQIGKVMQDMCSFSGFFHAQTGWCVAIAGLLLFQDQSHDFQRLLPNISVVENINLAYGNMVWGICLALSLLAIGISVAGREKRQNRGKIEGITLLLLLAALSIYAFNPAVAGSWLTSTSINLANSIALITGGLIASLAVARAFNGARRSSPTMILIGLTALSAELMLVMAHISDSAENLTIFGYSTLFICLFFAGTAFKNMSFAEQRMDYVHA